MIYGKDILICKGASPVPIAAAKSCTINFGAGTAEKSSPISAAARCFDPGRTSWSIDVSALVGDISSMMIAGEVLTLTVKVSGASVLTGTAICTECRVTATTGNLAQGSFRFQGSGELSQVIEE